MNASDAQIFLRKLAALEERVAALEAAGSNSCSAAELPAVPEAATLQAQADLPSNEGRLPPGVRPRSSYGRYLAAKDAET